MLTNVKYISYKQLGKRPNKNVRGHPFISSGDIVFFWGVRFSSQQWGYRRGPQNLPVELGPKIGYKNLVGWCLGPRGLGLLGVPLSNNFFHKEMPGI